MPRTLLSHGFEVAVFDGDAALLRNPWQMFLSTIAFCDPAFMFEDPSTIVTLRDYGINNGLVIARPLRPTLAVLKQYHDELGSRQMTKLQIAADQAILNEILHSGRIFFDSVNRRFVVHPWTGFPPTGLTIQFHQPWYLTNYYTMDFLLRTVNKDPRPWRPYVFHLACMHHPHNRMVM
jgi:hypothetical protein